MLENRLITPFFQGFFMAS